MSKYAPTGSKIKYAATGSEIQAGAGGAGIARLVGRLATQAPEPGQASDA